MFSAGLKRKKPSHQRGLHMQVYINGSEARAKVGGSQSAFAKLIGVSLRTLQDGEQGRRQPTGATQTLLRVASQHPEALRDLYPA